MQLYYMYNSLNKYEYTENQRTVFKLLGEIDDICKKNDIDYCAVNSLALLAYRREDIGDICTGSILMTMNNALKFVRAYEKEIKKDRAIEWIGNNDNFPGIFIRYIDKNTVYYTPNRLISENNLGMFITIEIMRPAGKRDIYARAIENAWRNHSLKNPADGHKWEPKIIKVIEITEFLIGKKNVAKILLNFFIKTYDSKHIFNKVWYRRGTNIKYNYYDARLFEKQQYLQYKNEIIRVPINLREYIYKVYGKYASNELKLKVPHNSINFFCSADISFADLEIDIYRNEMKDILKKLNYQTKKTRQLKKARNKCFDIMLRSYYRYYYGLVVFKDIKELEWMYYNERFEELDEVLLPYLRMAIKFSNKKKSIFINRRINRLLVKRYGANIGLLFKKTPKAFRKGIEIYDINGNLVRLIEGK